MIRVATVQFQSLPAAVEENFARVEHFARRAAADGVQLVAFPELCLVGNRHLARRGPEYLRALAEPDDGPSVARVSALARELGVGLGVGLLTERDGWLFNAYAVCLPDGGVHIHRKLHASGYEGISDGGAYTVFDTPWGVRVGILICLDNNIVENVRATALAGAQILVAPHQTGGTHSMVPFAEDPIPVSVWENRAADPRAVEEAFRGTRGREWPAHFLPARAQDNGMFIVFSNGVGRDDDEVRTGNAMIVDPCGRIIAESGAVGEDMIAADLDLDLVAASVGRWWMGLRRPELYRSLARREDRADRAAA